MAVVNCMHFRQYIVYYFQDMEEILEFWLKYLVYSQQKAVQNLCKPTQQELLKDSSEDSYFSCRLHSVRFRVL